MLLKKDKVEGLLEALSKDSTVFVPKVSGGVAKFMPYTSPDEMDLSILKTQLPPKDLLFPQAEKMYHYGLGADGNMFIDPIVESEGQVLFGVRPCDMASIERMDDVFLTKGFIDEFYEDKREKLLCVGLACGEPAEACFCESMGLSPNEAPAADIMLWDTGEVYLVAAQTEKGEDALGGAWKPYLEEGDADTARGPEAHCSLSIDTTDLMGRFAALEKSDELWDSFSAKCINCGTCTFICPSCYCFDIAQENRCKEGVRFRCWDSCMFSEYTQMAGGHNPRPNKIDRVRNRYMHKLSFFEDRYGKSLCVGCGRCMENCPVAIDITVLIENANRIYAGLSEAGLAGDAPSSATREEVAHA